MVLGVLEACCVLQGDGVGGSGVLNWEFWPGVPVDPELGVSGDLIWGLGHVLLGVI